MTGDIYDLTLDEPIAYYPLGFNVGGNLVKHL